MKSSARCALALCAPRCGSPDAQLVDDIVLVDEDEVRGPATVVWRACDGLMATAQIAEAILRMLELEKSLVEGSGATALAAVLHKKIPVLPVRSNRRVRLVRVCSSRAGKLRAKRSASSAPAATLVRAWTSMRGVPSR